jgi:predicted amidohydrolase
LDLLKWVE